MSVGSVGGGRLAGLWRLLGSSLVARVGMAAVNFGQFWLLSHHYPAERLGGFSLLMNLYLMLQLLPLLGLSLPLARRVATDEAGRAAEVANALALALPVAGLIAAGLVAAGHLAYPPWLALPFTLVALAMLPTAWTLVAESVLLGLERAGDIARVQFGEALLRTAGTAAVVALDGGLAAVFAVFLVLRVLSAWRYARHPAVPRPRRALLSMALQRRNAAEIPVYLGIAVLAALASRLDIVALSRLGDLHEVGRYAAAARLYDAALMLPTLAALILMPTLARRFQSDPQSFGPMLVRAVGAVLALGSLLALAVAGLAAPIVRLLYPPELHGAAPVLRWLIFAAVWLTVDQLLSSTMIAAQAPRQDLASMAVALALLAAGLLLLVPLQGPVGAAQAVLLAMLGRVAWRVRWAAQRFAVPALWGVLARVALAAGAAVAALVLAEQRLGEPAALAAALTVYALAALASGLAGPRPWQQAAAAWRARRGAA
ncbi:lipopolysaccharide biosynthesis protein [Piscinibacter sakaiensis]|uniref:Polysaccharide biosynthesis protein n=1 Tax=Piscinibacter sakaiensis TaxID=1547922 RepID=A0A0K8NZP6_PISS1|nr:hypothetical protein [Piscinibacter sakaiensis]GAP35856.1 polysaccharide biosynthesis protein [Piscinibacter sakaiensis]